jgi:hypothetical protein
MIRMFGESFPEITTPRLWNCSTAHYSSNLLSELRNSLRHTLGSWKRFLEYPRLENVRWIGMGNVTPRLQQKMFPCSACIFVHVYSKQILTALFYPSPFFSGSLCQRISINVWCMKNAVSWDLRRVALRRVLRLLVTANVPSVPILVTLMMEELHSSETSVLTRATWRNIPEDGVLQSHRRENLESYIALTHWAP